MINKIGGPSPDRFALRRELDGVYRVDGRMIPVCDHCFGAIDDRESVVPIHDLKDVSVSLLGGHLGVHVKQGELELPIRAQTLDAVSDSIVILAR